MAKIVLVLLGLSLPWAEIMDVKSKVVFAREREPWPTKEFRSWSTRQSRAAKRLKVHRRSCARDDCSVLVACGAHVSLRLIEESGHEEDPK